ncbi:MAG: hypothetical protein FJW21_07185 [Acidimicrobiia bacterium]|nr:hypothetical protein [Acidimicrobiia bacterium]
MLDPVQLLVPIDARFRAIGPELAGKYCAAQGGSEADVASVATAVTDAVEAMSATARDVDAVTMNFQTPSGQVEVTVRCGGQSAVVTRRLPAPKG